MSRPRRSLRIQGTVVKSEYRSKNSSETTSESDLDDVENIMDNLQGNSRRIGKSYKEIKSEDIMKTPKRNKNVNSSKISECSPPKQRKTQEIPENLFSPSTFLNRLSIEDDSDEDKDEVNKITGEEKKSHDVKESCRIKYKNARKILNIAETNILPGREKEVEELTEYLLTHEKNRKSGSLYISGQPGTGKTACIQKVMKSDEVEKRFVKVFINCTSIPSIGSIYKKMTAELKLKISTGKTEKDHLNAIERYLGGKHSRMVLLVLDEIDQLVGQRQSILYTLFEWPSKTNYKIILIGIANSLDLTDRFLTRLNTQCDLKPKHMHFTPYTKQQIVEILKSRLEEAGANDIFPPATLQLLAAKVSAVSGDIRKALDIGRRVVEIAEEKQNEMKNPNITEYKLNGIKPLINGESREQKDLSTSSIQITQVMDVLNKIYGGSQTLEQDLDDSFPLQQKILLCCLMLILKKDRNKDITIGRLYDVYKKVCNKRKIQVVDQGEFVNLCSLVETRGIVRLIPKKEPRLSKITLQWIDEDVNVALKDKQLMASILDDVSCLSRN